MIKVLGVKVIYNDTAYNPGDVIKDMSQKEEDDLIKDGYAERVEMYNPQSEPPKTSSKAAGPTAKEMIMVIEATDDIEELKRILIEEQTNEKRKTVIAAAAGKIKEIMIAAAENGNSDQLDLNFDVDSLIVTQ